MHFKFIYLKKYVRKFNQIINVTKEYILTNGLYKILIGYLIIRNIIIKMFYPISRSDMKPMILK